MARSTEEIYNSMVTEKQTYASLSALMPLYDLSGPTPDNPFRKLLDDINNNSKVGVWRGALLMVAFAIYSFEVFQDVFKAEIEQLAKESIAGNLAWYAAQVKKWQYGFALIWDSTTYRYFYSDTTSSAAIAARLVSKVSITEVLGPNTSAVIIKVAKLSGSNLVPLDSSPGTELESLTYYINRIKFAGVHTEVISLPADKVKFTLRRFYDGTLDLNDVKTEDEAVLKQFLKDIDFNGVLYLNDLIDTFQALSSSVEPSLMVVNCLAKADADPAFTAVTESYSPASGYFELVPIGPTAGVDTYIEYIPR